MPLRCIAIDDEPLALELLEDNIKNISFLDFQRGFYNPLDAVTYMNQHEVDLVFLDIQMPGLTGMQLIKSMPKQVMYILVTAYEQYAVDAFELDVVDYLVKPVSMERFIKACNKANDLYHYKHKSSDINNLDYMFIQADYKLIKVNFDEILWIESLKDYIRIHQTQNKKPLVARMSMKAMEEQLPANRFIRIHKSYIVSTQAITAVQKNVIYIGSVELPVGDIFKHNLQNITNTNI